MSQSDLRALDDIICMVDNALSQAYDVLDRMAQGDPSDAELATLAREIAALRSRKKYYMAQYELVEKAMGEITNTEVDGYV